MCLAPALQKGLKTKHSATLLLLRLWRRESANQTPLSPDTTGKLAGNKMSKYIFFAFHVQEKNFKKFVEFTPNFKGDMKFSAIPHISANHTRTVVEQLLFVPHLFFFESSFRGQAQWKILENMKKKWLGEGRRVGLWIISRFLGSGPTCPSGSVMRLQFPWPFSIHVQMLIPLLG